MFTQQESPRHRIKEMEDTPTDTETLAIRAALGQFPALEIALIFGSVATGRARADSDLDIAVQFPKRMPAELYIAMMNALIDATGRVVDLIDLRTVGGELFGQIMKRHVKLIGAEPMMVALRARHMGHETDFMPYYRAQRRARLEQWIA